MALPFQLLVFDWDGTVLDSVSAIVACTRQTLEELSRPALPDQQIRDLIGLGLRETVEVLCPGCDDSLFGEVLATYRQLWHATYNKMPTAFPGVPETLSCLKAEGYLLAVATAKSRSGLSADMERSGLAPLFDATRTVDEARSKPDPQMVLDLLDEMGVLARQALVIGDTVHDLQMARNAGVVGVAVTSGAQPADVLASARPEACLADLTDLPAWLESRLAVAEAM